VQDTKGGENGKVRRTHIKGKVTIFVLMELAATLPFAGVEELVNKTE